MPSRDARYLLVADALQHRIHTLAPNSPLPTEQQLGQQFGVSRITVRRALGLLERSGLVSRHRGRGTLVSPPKIARWLSIYTFEEDLRQQGIKYETRLIDFQFRCVPPEPIREQLALPAGSPVGFLSLVRVVDGLIICHDRHYLPPMIASRLDPTIVRDRPLVDVLSQITQMRIRSLNWTTEIIPASHDVARALGITPGVLVLANTGTEYLDDASPAQVTVMFYRVDRVKFRFAVDRSK